MTQLVGRRLGRYEIQQEIGRGGMARVYRAVDTLLQRPVAIKVLAPQLSMDPEFARRFEREAITAANLRHPTIVTIYDVGEQDSLHFIAMEFVQGRSLHAILEDRDALGLGYAISILDPLARALDYAHSRGAVHRDVKPHNVLIDLDGRVLLTDFGIAQMPDADTERLTRTGVFMGTPEYISPEQAEARRVDGRSDLYSLGVVAYEIITGRVPFSGATPQLIIAHAQTPPPPPSRIAPHIPGELDLVLTRALAKDAAQRYSNGATMVAALQAIARQHGIPLASSQQIADLVKPADSSGQPTISLGKDQATAASHPPVVAPPPLAAAPIAQPSGHSSIPPVPPPPAAPAVPTVPPPASSVRYPARQPARQPGNNTLNRTILLLIIGLILLVLLALLMRGRSSDANSVTLPGDTPTAQVPGEVAPPPPDVAPTEPATATPILAEPTATIVPTTPTPVPAIVPPSPMVIIPTDTIMPEPPPVTTEPESTPTEPPPTPPTPTDTPVAEPEPPPEATATPVPPATEPPDIEPPPVETEPPPSPPPPEPPPPEPPPPDQYPGPIAAPTMSTTITEAAITPALPPPDRPTDSFTPVPPATPIPTTPPVPEADLPDEPDVDE